MNHPSASSAKAVAAPGTLSPEGSHSATYNDDAFITDDQPAIARVPSKKPNGLITVQPLTRGECPICSVMLWWRPRPISYCTRPAGVPVACGFSREDRAFLQSPDCFASAFHPSAFSSSLNEFYLAEMQPSYAQDMGTANIGLYSVYACPDVFDRP